MYVCMYVFLFLDISKILKKEPDTADLIGLLSDIKYKWKLIGVALKVKVGDDILGSCTQSSEEDGNKLYTVVRSWANTRVTDVTWEMVIAAVEGPIVDHKSTAVKIREFLTKSEVFTAYLRKDDFHRY